MAEHGGKRDNAGRPPKADEQKLIEKLSPLEDKAYAALKTNIEANEAWAVKMWFEYMYGKPKQLTEVVLDDNRKSDLSKIFPDAEEI